MVERLDELLATLHSDEGRLELLNEIYITGDTDVADRILAMDVGSTVLDREIEHAKQKVDMDRFRDLAKMKIDVLLVSALYSATTEIVTRWDDPELANHAIKRLISGVGDSQMTRNGLASAAEIAQAFGRGDAARGYLEKLLTLLDGKPGYELSTADTLIRLERYDEAIDRFLVGEDTSQALNLAKEHSTGRVNSIASWEFNRYRPGFDSAELYVECAAQIDKTEEAKSFLVKYVGSLRIYHSPARYEGVVKALVSLGAEKAARELVGKVAVHEAIEKSSGKVYHSNRPEELARLYHVVGETGNVKIFYEGRIAERIRKGHDPDSVMRDITTAVELTGDTATFMELKFPLYEKQGNFAIASLLADSLGKPELGKKYLAMAQLVQSAQTQRAQ